MATFQAHAIPGSAFYFLEGCLLPLMRDRLATQMLAAGHDYLLFIDDDTFVPPDAAARLIALAKRENAGIACGVVPALGHRDIVLNISKDGEHFKPWPYGQFQVDRCGAACMLIRRAVLETLQSPWFVADADMSEDYRFCDRAREAGFTIWCDAEIVCEHYKTIGLLRLCPPRTYKEI